MESLQRSLTTFLKERNIDGNMDAQLEQLFHHPVLQRWLADHPGWDQERLTRFAIKVKQFISEQERCVHCRGLHECSNLIQGHAAELISYGQMLDVSYVPCHYKGQEDERLHRRRLIKSHHIPKEILNARFSHFEAEEDQKRMDAINAVLEFCLHARPGEDGQGIYLYGALGVGKSYLLGAACNKLAQRHISSYMVYTPAFFHEIKTAIAEGKVDEKMEALQKVPVLILDDIGAETMSAWARDEVLGPILQYRMMEKLPTLYTSNYDYAQLEEHLAYTQRGGIENIEQMKAKRMMERIRHYTDEYFLSGYNRRKSRKTSTQS